MSVNRPDYYKQNSRKECWDEFIDMYGARVTFTWCLLTAKKYLYRAGNKDNNPAYQDINKARTYLAKADEIREAYDLKHYYIALYNDVKNNLIGSDYEDQN